MSARPLTAPVSALILVAALSGCATTSPSPSVGTASGSGEAAGSAGTVINAAASINAWGSILAQLGGSHVHATSIITNPSTDPHDYEPTPADGRTIATARLFVENGIGYDSWADKAVKANPDPSQTILNVGALTGIPDGGNPHRWYSPGDVSKVADAITADLKRADPPDAAYFDTQRAWFDNRGLRTYHSLISDIRSRYAGTPVGASESVFAPLSDALGLTLVTPPSFLRAISEGTDPSAADKATIDAEITGKKIKVYVFNSQNATPDVAEQVTAAKAADIPVVQVTETLTPQGVTFQEWQSTQLKALKAALATATGR